MTHDDTTPVTTTPATPDAVPPPTGSEPRPGWRLRLHGVRSVVAVALAALVLGGLGGAALGHAADGGDQGGRGGPEIGRAHV